MTFRTLVVPPGGQSWSESVARVNDTDPAVRRPPMHTATALLLPCVPGTSDVAISRRDVTNTNPTNLEEIKALHGKVSSLWEYLQGRYSSDVVVGETRSPTREVRKASRSRPTWPSGDTS